MGKAEDKILSLQSVVKSFGTKRALDGISLNVVRGEIYGFLGPNGAGKTTTIRCIMNFYKPTSGRIKIFGQDSTHFNPLDYNRIGFLSADSPLYGKWSANEHIDFVASTRGVSRQRADELAAQFELDIHTKTHRLSTGNKQKLTILLAMMHQPELLILDEPTRGLDPLLQEAMHHNLLDFKKSGGSVFVSSHDLGEVEKICDNIGIIKQGKMVASETLQSLRKMQVHNVRIVFSDKFSQAEFQMPGVEIIQYSKNQLTANVSGDLNSFMKQVVGHKLHDLEVNHLSLEEVFLRYY